MAEEAAKPVGRPMRFPYTWSAKIAQFPLKWYVNSNPLWKYYFLGVIVALPVFYKVDRLCKYSLIIGSSDRFANYGYFV